MAIKFNFTKEEMKDREVLNKLANQIKTDVLGAAEEGKSVKFSVKNLVSTLSYNPEFAEAMKFRAEQKLGREISKGAKFSLDAAEANRQVSTIVEPILDAFTRSNEVLNWADIRTLAPSNTRELTEWHFERTGQNLTEVQAGTDGFRTMRKGDVVQADTKVQASTEITELALTKFDAFELVDFVSDLTKEVQTRMKLNMFYAGQGVANGTARTVGLWRGIDNNYGVNGIGDANNFIGAIKYATKALADTAITGAGGVASTDSYDLCVKVGRLLMPRNIDNDSVEYAYVMNSATWGAVSTVQDLNGRFKSHTAIDPTTQKPIDFIDGKRVIIDEDVEDKFVFLIPKGFYRIYLTNSIQSLNDSGLVSLREGKIVYVARTFGVGSPRYGFRYLPTTDATIGTTAVDNTRRNAYRYFRID